MVLYYLELTNKTYDLNNIYDRVILREDLRQQGFFKMLDFQRFYPWFDQEDIGKPRVLEVMTAVKFFVTYKMPHLIKWKH